MNNTEIEKLYSEERQKIIGKLKKSFGNHSKIDYDEIFQEGLTRVIFLIEEKKFRGASSLSTFLYAVCRRVALEEFRKHTKHLHMDEETLHTHEKVTTEEKTDMDLLEEEQEATKQRENLRQALDKIGQNCKEILELKIVQGKTYKEIISIRATTETEQSIRQRGSRCLRKLRGLMI